MLLIKMVSRALKTLSGGTRMQIDLTLAVNYVPAALCLVRLMFYLSLIGMIRPGEEIGAYSLLALSLWSDRVIFRVFLRNPIFDSSAIILAVYFSNIMLTLRHLVPVSHLSFLGAVVNFGWIGCCLAMIVEPPHMRRVFEKRARFYHVMPAVVTAVALAAQIQVHALLEDNGTRFARGICFALMCLKWIYVVGIHQSQALENLRDNSSHFLSRFAPVLYLPSSLAVLFALLAWAALGYQYYKVFLEAPESSMPDVETGIKHDSSMPQILESIPEEHELEEMFRLAKQNRTL